MFDKPISFGNRFRLLRLGRQLGIRALAKRLDVSHTYLSHIESDHVTPGQEFVIRAAAELDCDPDELLLAAGKLPKAAQDYVRTDPVQAAALLREIVQPYRAEPAVARSSQQASIHRNGAGPYEIVNADCVEWMNRQPPRSFEAIVTDPPYGVIEYDAKNLTKMREGRGGIWRIPPELGGHKRRPVPRFTVHTVAELQRMRDFFGLWAEAALRILAPGATVIVATNPLMSQHLYGPLLDAGLEFRGELVRVVRTLRGGDRPKGAEKEFPEVCAMPRSAWEPWGIFRKPLEGTLASNLRKWRTGGLRRISTGVPFSDLIWSERTPSAERKVAPHPSLKPMSFMVEIARAALPLGEGQILDPFCGAGTTIAAASLIGYRSVGIEVVPEYYQMAKRAIPQLAKMYQRRVENLAKVTPGGSRPEIPLQLGI